MAWQRALPWVPVFVCIPVRPLGPPRCCLGRFARRLAVSVGGLERGPAARFCETELGSLMPSFSLCAVPRFFVVGCLLCAGTAATAQAQSEPLSPVVIVSANRVGTEAGLVGSSVDIIDAKEIDRRQQPQLLDLLRRLPGVSIARNGGFGSTATLRLRGSETGMVKVLIDGVEVNDASGVGNDYDFNALLTDAIERVEVLKGPQSALYGNDAVGGVISIQTKGGAAITQLSGLFEGGSYGTRRAQAGVRGGAADGTRYFVSWSDFSTDGFSRTVIGTEKDGSHAREAKARLSLPVGDEGMRLEASAQWARLDSDFDPSSLQDGPGAQDKESWQAHATAHLPLGNGRVENALALAHAEVDRDFDEPAGFFRFSSFRSRRDAIDYQASVQAFSRDRLLAGASYERARARTLTRDAKGTPAPGIDDRVATRSVFAHYLAQPADGLALTLGGRYDDPDRFKARATWRATAAYSPEALTGTVLRASYGSASKAPSLFQLYAEGFGNPSLRPERARGGDIGLERTWSGGALRTTLTLFQNDYRDLIGFVDRYENVDRARTRGAEAALTWAFQPTWSLSANYTRLTAEDRVNRQTLPRRPRHSANASLDWSPNPAFDISLTWRYVGTQRDNGFSDDKTRAYAVSDFAVRWRGLDMIGLFARIDNILDKHYEETRGFRASRRAFYGGASVSF
jgi:vitamin B12 transporter